MTSQDKITVEPLPDTAVLNDVRKYTLLLPYARKNGCIPVKSLKTHLKKTLLSNVKTDIVYTNSKLSSKLKLFVLPTTTLKIMLGRPPDV